MVNIKQIQRIIYLKCLIAAAGSIVALIGWDKIAALSLLIGGTIGICGSAIYKAIAYRKNAYVTPALLIKRHFVAEGLKMGLTVLLFAVTLMSFTDVKSSVLLLGYVLTSMAYWLGLIW